MMKKPVTWTTRSFGEQIDAKLLPNIISRLTGAPVRLRELLGNIPHRRLREKPDGKWSVLEHAGHLSDLEGLWLQRFVDFGERRTMLTAWDVTNQKTETADHNDRTPDELADRFSWERHRLVTTIAGLNEEALRHPALHPRLQRPMPVVDLAHFIAEHDDHHLAMMAWLAAQRD